MLIIWDRLFGTFTPENTKAIYGLVHPLNTWGIVWAQVHHFVYTIQLMWNTPGIVNKFLVAAYPPGWTVAKTGEWIAPFIPSLDPKHKKFDPQIPLPVTIYMLSQFTCTSTAYIVYSLIISHVTLVDAVVGALYLFLCLEVYGYVLEGHRFARRLELLRLSLSLSLSLRFTFYLSFSSLFLWTWITFSFISFIWFFYLRNAFGIVFFGEKAIKTK